MKIENSDVSLFSEHSKKHEIYEEENLQKWDRPEEAPARLQNMDRLELSTEFQGIEEETALDPKLQSIVRALESLTGKKIDISFAKNLQISSENRPEGVGWGIDYSYEKHEIKEESLDFSASGNVTTEDGKNIDFSLAYKMYNKTESHESISFKAGDALIDPLVLNFDSNVVSISNVKHEFDLDLDGKSDTFSFVGSGSGFLALDKNKDGKINDGSELFGPTLGNGFDELKEYDTDKNNWIDENDAIYNDLLIWTKDEEGKESLFSLKEKNVGAIYLNRVETQFDLNAAQLKESSIYLQEDGKVGSVQEIDLVV